jgi:ABC-2 type transport system ATP-binding protein
MIIELEGVDKRYGQVRALDGADLAVPDGAVMGLVGPNGAGKTTAMLLMSSLLARDGGSVRVAGVDPEVDPKSVRRTIGWMPDVFGVYESLDATEYLDFFAAAHGVRPEARAGLVTDLLALVDLEDKAGADVNTLSRGMKQRLSLARALVHDPQVLILDEPASGLDPRARVHLRQLIAELARMGRTVVISSHILSELEGICSHLAVVDKGKVISQGSIDDIRAALVGSRRVTARIPDSEVDHADDLMRGHPEVGDVSVEQGQIRFTIGGDGSVSASLLREMVESGIEVAEWRVESAGLEELFMRITDDGKAEAESEPG